MQSTIDRARTLLEQVDAARPERPDVTAPVYVTDCENFAIAVLSGSVEDTAAHVHVVDIAASVAVEETTTGEAPYTWAVSDEGMRTATIVAIPAAGEGPTAAIAFELELADTDSFGFDLYRIDDGDLTAALCTLTTTTLEHRER